MNTSLLLRRSILFLPMLVAAVSGGCGAPESATGEHRALLLPYVEKGELAHHAGWMGDGLLAVLTPVLSENKQLEVLRVRGSEVAPAPPVTLPVDLESRCPEEHPLVFVGAEALGLAKDGSGLLLTSVRCRDTTQGGVAWFARRAEEFTWLAEPQGTIPDAYRPAPQALACSESAGCRFLFNRALQPALATGGSSVSVARFEDGAFEGLAMDETEDEDDRFFELIGVAAAGDAFLVTAMDYAEDAATVRAYLLRDDA